MDDIEGEDRRGGRRQKINTVRERIKQREEDENKSRSSVKKEKMRKG